VRQARQGENGQESLPPRQEALQGALRFTQGSQNRQKKARLPPGLSPLQRALHPQKIPAWQCGSRRGSQSHYRHHWHWHCHPESSQAQISWMQPRLQVVRFTQGRRGLSGPLFHGKFQESQLSDVAIIRKLFALPAGILAFGGMFSVNGLLVPLSAVQRHHQRADVPLLLLQKLVKQPALQEAERKAHDLYIHHAPAGAGLAQLPGGGIAAAISKPHL